MAWQPPGRQHARAWEHLLSSYCTLDSDCAMEKSFWLFKGVALAAKIHVSVCALVLLGSILNRKEMVCCSYGTDWMSCWGKCYVPTESDAHWTAAEEGVHQLRGVYFVEEEQWAAATGTCIAPPLQVIRQPCLNPAPAPPFNAAPRVRGYRIGAILQSRRKLLIWTCHGFPKAVSYPELRHTASHCQGMQKVTSVLAELHCKRHTSMMPVEDGCLRAPPGLPLRLRHPEPANVFVACLSPWD